MTLVLLLNATSIEFAFSTPIDTWAQVTWNTIFVFLDLVILGGSGYALWGFRYIIPSTAIWKRRSIFLLNLAVADLMSGVMSVPFVIAAISINSNTKLKLEFLQAGRIFLKSINPMCMASVAIDTAHAVMDPMNHRAITYRSTILIVVAMWVTSALVIVVGTIASFHPDVVFFVFLVLQSFKLLACYILTIASYTAVWVKQKQRSFSKEQAQQNAEDRKLLGTLMVILSFVMLSWLPDVIVFIYIQLCDRPRLSFQYALLSFLLSYVQTAADPVIHIFRIPEFKAHLVGCWQRSRFTCHKEPTVEVAREPKTLAPP